MGGFITPQDVYPTAKSWKDVEIQQLKERIRELEALLREAQKESRSKYRRVVKPYVPFNSPDWP